MSTVGARRLAAALAARESKVRPSPGPAAAGGGGGASEVTIRSKMSMPLSRPLPTERESTVRPAPAAAGGGGGSDIVGVKPSPKPSAMGPAAGGNKYVHITPYELTLPMRDLTTMPYYESIRGISLKTGKPIGLWYAMNDEWAPVLQRISSSATTTLYNKYELPVAVIDAAKKSGRILMVNSENIKVLLIKPFEAWVRSEEAFNTILEDVLNDIALNEPDMFDKLFKSLYIKSRSILNLTGIRDRSKLKLKEAYELALPISNYLKRKYKSIAAIPEGLIDDIFIFSSAWSNYWMEVIAPKYDGIEFDASVISKSSKEYPKYTWMRELEIPSGCIFHPERLFPAAGPQPARVSTITIKKGGYRRRHTRRTNKNKRLTRHHKY